MPKKIVIITSNDLISRHLLAETLGHLKQHKNLLIIYDASSTWKRVVKLINKKRISIIWLLKVTIARFFQRMHLRNYTQFSTKLIPNSIIHNNSELTNFLNSNEDIAKVYCFRAGLVINKLNVHKANFINLHCAKIPKYAGLMSIARALADGDYNQECVLHKVVEAIDSGVILGKQVYKLDPSLPYWKNELHAYQVGASFLKKILLTEYKL
jgi:hypothetical protein